jgi:hypothetical protein
VPARDRAAEREHETRSRPQQVGQPGDIRPLSVAKSGMRRLPHSLTRGCGLQPTDERGYSRIIL